MKLILMNLENKTTVIQEIESNCCGAAIIYSDICSDCKEHCDSDYF